MELDLALLLVLSIYNFFMAFTCVVYDLAAKKEINSNKMYTHLILAITTLFFYLILM